MNHNTIRLHLVDYVNGKLPEDLLNQVSDHLLTCKECAADAEWMKVFFVDMKQEKLWNPSEQYFSTLLPRIHQRIEEKRTFDMPQWIQRLVLPLAAFPVMAILFVQLFLPNQNQQNGELYSLLQQMSSEEIQQVAETILSAAIEESQEIQQGSSSLLTSYLKFDSLDLATVEYDVQTDVEQLSEEETSHLLALLEQ